jgi:hypothetical protein
MSQDPKEQADASTTFGSENIRNLISRIRGLEHELDEAFEKMRADLRLRIERDKVAFEEHILRRHRELRVGLWNYVRHARPMVMVTAPLVYALIIPLVILDLFVSIYQAVCFPVYGIGKIHRRDYIILDRQSLAYLNGLEKLNCAYCAYANGLIAYTREIAARTEKYWCPIKHARRLVSPHAFYADFVEYGDAEAYRTELEVLRKQLAALGG